MYKKWKCWSKLLEEMKKIINFAYVQIPKLKMKKSFLLKIYNNFLFFFFKVRIEYLLQILFPD